MSQNELTTDYLVVGAGATGMAFVDTLLSDSDADIIIVDRNDKPGGHWNFAYPFVTLHQPSAFYGVSSRELSTGQLDEVGLNKGLASLATGAEVSAYYDRVMHDRFLASGRVRYFPMSEYRGDNQFTETLSGKTCTVKVRKKRVDATYYQTKVPATHTPGFKIDEDVWLIPPNQLPKLNQRPERFVVLGGGKTGMDTCIWLLEKGVDPDDIRWIMPRDGWLIDRINTQPAIEFFHHTVESQAAQFEAIASAQSVDDLFERLEQAGVLIRIDETVKPTMFHGATISQAELAELRRIKNVIRMGRVSHLSANRIMLEEGEIETTADTVHIDCTASAISNLETKPIFEDGLITPQTVRSYQPVFSASVIAHVEATLETDAEKNALCAVVPLPNHDTDWIRMMIPLMMNQYNWSRDSNMREWMTNNRLDGFSSMIRSIDENDTEKMKVLKRMREASMPAMQKLHQLMAEIGEQS